MLRPGLSTLSDTSIIVLQMQIALIPTDSTITRTPY